MGAVPEVLVLSGMVTGATFFLLTSHFRLAEVVPMEGVEPTHSYEYQILSLARLPIPPHRPSGEGKYKSAGGTVNKLFGGLL